MRLLPFAALVTLGLVALTLSPAAAAAQRIVAMPGSTRRGWTGTPERFSTLVSATEKKHGIPTGLLSRLLYQESRFDPTAVNKSSGAQGIAQVMPATARDPGFGVAPLANPFDPQQAIPWAGAYLAAMRRYVGTWELALAAYNWGPGYVKTRPRSAWPAETVAYVRDISADVSVFA